MQKSGSAFKKIFKGDDIADVNKEKIYRILDEGMKASNYHFSVFIAGRKV